MKLRSTIVALLLIVMFSTLSLSAFTSEASAAPCQPGSAGYHPTTDLKGQIKYNGATTTATVTNTSGVCAYEVGLAVYRRFDEVVDHQELFS
ncbi:MAG TPA: hypothetical protein VHL11_11985, partial [Phototrophicaceae bacterium]|nr:hypothetical protein [Phototrophicaceae bacterium]